MVIRKMNIVILILLLLLSSCMNSGNQTIMTDETKAMRSFVYPVEHIPADSDEVHTCVSEDGNIKFYSWNTGEGGTMPVYGVLCQYRTSDGGTKVVDLGKEDMDVAWARDVHSIKKDNRLTYYIVTRSHRISSNDGYMWMEAFVIDHDTLRSVSVLDSGDDLDECDWEVNYRISDWSYSTNDEGWNWLFEYNSRTRDLYVPIIVFIEESVPIISDRYKLYCFNGMEFVYKGESPHKGLHESVSCYKRLSKYFQTKNYIVRVDMMDDQTYRYASWNSSAGISEKPDIIIFDGKYDAKKDCFTFINDGIEYIVGYSEYQPISEGIYEHHEFLLVKKDGKILLKEERV